MLFLFSNPHPFYKIKIAVLLLAQQISRSGKWLIRQKPDNFVSWAAVTKPGQRWRTQDRCFDIRRPDGKSFPAGVRRFESCPQHQSILTKYKITQPTLADKRYERFDQPTSHMGPNRAFSQHNRPQNQPSHRASHSCSRPIWEDLSWKNNPFYGRWFAAVLAGCGIVWSKNQRHNVVL